MRRRRVLVPGWSNQRGWSEHASPGANWTPADYVGIQAWYSAGILPGTESGLFQDHPPATLIDGASQTVYHWRNYVDQWHLSKQGAWLPESAAVNGGFAVKYSGTDELSLSDIVTVPTNEEGLLWAVVRPSSAAGNSFIAGVGGSGSSRETGLAIVDDGGTLRYGWRQREDVLREWSSGIGEATNDQWASVVWISTGSAFACYVNGTTGTPTQVSGTGGNGEWWDDLSAPMNTLGCGARPRSSSIIYEFIGDIAEWGMADGVTAVAQHMTYAEQLRAALNG